MAFKVQGFKVGKTGRFVLCLAFVGRTESRPPCILNYILEGVVIFMVYVG